MTGACRIARVSWDEAWGVIAARWRGRARKVAQPIPDVGVDEKAFRKGHRYHTIVCDLERATVEFVAEDRRTESLAAYYAQLTDDQRDGLAGGRDGHVGAVPRRDASGSARWSANIVFDRFHIMREMSKAVDTVRNRNIARGWTQVRSRH